MRIRETVSGLIILIAATVPFARANTIDASVNEFLRTRHIPGAAVLVVRNGVIVKNAGYGFANLETRTRVTPDTVFEIGSMTKQFTAAAVMLLSERGKLSLDDPATKYFPDAPASWGKITIRHLLTHTSGIRNHVAIPDFMDLFRTSVTGRTYPDRDGLLAELFKLPSEFDPGESWAYDNTGYILLGIIIEKVSGENYFDFLEENIFRPAGMRSTRGTDPKIVIGRRANGYVWTGKDWENRPVLSPHIAFSAGSIVSTTGDIAKWDAALRSGKILKKETLETMRTPTRLNDGGRAPFDYGLGWFVDVLNGRRRVQHDGGTPGFSSIMQQYPEDRLTVIVLTNHADTILETFASEIAESYLPALRSKKPAVVDPTGFHEETFRALLKGEIESARFSLAMRLHLRSATGRGLFGWYSSLGEFKGLRLTGTEKDGTLDVFRYEADFSTNKYRFTFKTGATGRIAQILYW